jgi:transcriptional regulator with XRE-family HTH domain
MRLTDQKSQDLVTSLGKAIRARRLEKCLSQEAVAELAGFDRTYISMIERGTRNPSFTNLCRFAIAFNITPSELLKGISIDNHEN